MGTKIQALNSFPAQVRNESGVSSSSCLSFALSSYKESDVDEDDEIEVLQPLVQKIQDVIVQSPILKKRKREKKSPQQSPKKRQKVAEEVPLEVTLEEVLNDMKNKGVLKVETPQIKQ